MRKIVDYIILDSSIARDLEGKVKTAINNGWEPQGGICYKLMYVGEIEKFYQAMVRYEQ